MKQPTWLAVLAMLSAAARGPCSQTAPAVFLVRPAGGQQLVSGQPLRVEARVTAGPAAEPTYATARLVGVLGEARVPLNDDGRYGDERAGDGLWSGLASAPAAGRYELKVRVQQGRLEAFTPPVAVAVRPDPWAWWTQRRRLVLAALAELAAAAGGLMVGLVRMARRPTLETVDPPEPDLELADQAWETFAGEAPTDARVDALWHEYHGLKTRSCALRHAVADLGDKVGRLDDRPENGRAIRRSVHAALELVAADWADFIDRREGQFASPAAASTWRHDARLLEYVQAVEAAVRRLGAFCAEEASTASMKGAVAQVARRFADDREEQQ